MAKTMIFSRGINPLEMADLQSLLVEAGASKGQVDFVEAITAVTPNQDDAMIVLLGTRETCADIELEANIKRAPIDQRPAKWSGLRVVDPVGEQRPVKKTDRSICKRNRAIKRDAICGGPSHIRAKSGSRKSCSSIRPGKEIR